MKIHVIRPEELTTEQIGIWAGLQARNPALMSPYFCPEFTLAVGRVRRDTFVAIIEDAGAIAGFFPFQMRAFGLGVPIGGPLSDYQGAIAGPDQAIDTFTLLRGCGLTSFKYSNLLVSQAALHGRDETIEPSHVIDLSQGYDAYVDERRKSGSQVFTKTQRQRRKLEREIGELRWVLKDTDPRTLAAVIDWKRQQYRRTRAVDGFGYGWTEALIKDLHRMDEPQFGGVLSSLWIGDRLIAGHMGMRSRTVWHHWYPIYDPELGKYSPGQILLLKMIESCTDLGVNTIDLGKGNYEFKLRLADRATDVADGYVGSPLSLPTLARRARFSIERMFERLPLGPASHWPGKAFRRIEGHLSYR